MIINVDIADICVRENAIFQLYRSPAAHIWYASINHTGSHAVVALDSEDGPVHLLGVAAGRSPEAAINDLTNMINSVI